MNKWLIIIVLFLIIPGNFMKGEKLTNITDMYFKRPMIKIDDEQFYIVDQGLKNCAIYNRKNYKKIAQFGGHGNGPGEFSSISYFSIDDHSIYISDYNKLSVFSKKGKLIKELKFQNFASEISPIGKNFIGKSHLKEPEYINSNFLKIQFNLYDSNFKKIKEIFLSKIHKYFIPGNENKKDTVYWIRDCCIAYVQKNRVYIGTTEKGFHFYVFDLNGKKLYEINKEFKKKKITGDEKKQKLAEIKSAWGETKWESFSGRNKIKFRDNYPAYTDFFVNDNKIYVFGYPIKDNYEIFILDLKGNLLKKGYLSYSYLGNVISKYNDLFKGNLYQLRENDEDWEIHEISIWNNDKINNQ